MELRAKRIDDHKIRIFAGCQHCLLVDKPAGPRPRDKGHRRITLGRAALDRTALRLPFVETAIEHGGTVKAQRLQHPPKARRPHHRADAVEYDARTLPDAVTAESSLKLRHRWHHEAQPRRIVRKLALQVEKISAGDMRRLKGAVPTHCDIGVGAAGWRRLQIGGAVEDPQIATTNLVC